MTNGTPTAPQPALHTVEVGRGLVGQVVDRAGHRERVLGLPREPSFDTSRPFNEVVRNAKNWNGKVG
jgi:hypothetical protein